MIAKVREVDPKHPRPNVWCIVRRKGQLVRLHLPSGHVLEIHIDEVRPAGVGLVIAAKGLVFEQEGE